MALTHPDGFLALPASGKGQPVLVLHAWWGLNDTIKRFCSHLAEAGFVVFAPDLYHGTVVDTIAGAESMARALDDTQAQADVNEAITFLKEKAGSETLAVIGFSLGAYYALDLSVKVPGTIRSVVVFYGTGPSDFSASQADYLGHFAEADEFEPLESVNGLASALKDAGRSATFHIYPGTGHWFFEPDRRDVYNEAAASLAWDRTIEFLRRDSAV